MIGNLTSTDPRPISKWSPIGHWLVADTVAVPASPNLDSISPQVFKMFASFGIEVAEKGSSTKSDGRNYYWSSTPWFWWWISVVQETKTWWSWAGNVRCWKYKFRARGSQQKQKVTGKENRSTVGRLKIDKTNVLMENGSLKKADSIAEYSWSTLFSEEGIDCFKRVTCMHSEMISLSMVCTG